MIQGTYKKYLLSNIQGFLAVTLLVLFSGCFEPVEPGSEDFYIKFYGGLLEDNGNKVVNRTNGGFAIVGSTESISTGASDMLLVLTQPNGDVDQFINFGGENQDHGHAIIATNDGGFILAGEYGDADGRKDIFVVRTDGSGDEIWSRILGDSIYSEVAVAVTQTADGGFAVVGHGENYPSSVEKPILMYRLDGNGNVIDLDSTGFTSLDRAAGIHQLADGGFAIPATRSIAGEEDMILIFLNAEGGKRSFDSYDNGGDEVMAGFTPTDDGFMLIGTTDNFGGVPGIIVVRTDLDGIEQWSKQYGVSGQETQASAILATQDGGAVITGFTMDGTDGSDMFIESITGTGESRWQKEPLGGISEDLGNGLTESADGSIIITGTTTYEGNAMVWLVKVEPENGFGYSESEN